MAELLNALETLLVLLPALAANGAPVLLRGEGTPLDARKRFIDGRPILGPGKTYEGLIVGTAAGAVTAYLLSSLIGDIRIAFYGALAALGALMGDIVAAFIKRRLGLPRGAPAPLLDQLDFYIGTLAALLAAGIRPEPRATIALAVAVPLLHRATNIAAHRLGLKSVPW